MPDGGTNEPAPDGGNLRTLFTPWRYEYLTAPKGAQECIFCAAATTDDRDESLVLFRGERVLVMLNRFPYTNGHVMVAPLAHVARLSDADDDALVSLIRMTAEAQRILSEEYAPDGYNIGMNLGQGSGAGFAEHVHMHVVPRWSGDTNFLTVTARTRIVPETLEATLARIRPKFEGLREA